jgi:RimJ/RimL family protein N-acetyltransferase
MATSTAAPTAEAPIVSLECMPETFVPAPDPRVRWLDQESDLALVREMWETKGIPVTRADWEDWHRQGYRHCGIVEDQRLAAVAAVRAYSPTAWELAAVQTREGYRSQGYSKAVCSFVTAHILASGRKVTCSTRTDNAPMLRVATSLGFQPLGNS